MKLRYITITGADNSIFPEALVSLTETYPRVEWGILFSGSKQGFHRFPSYEWIKELHKTYSSYPMNFSAHLCGAHVRKFCLEGVFSLSSEPFFEMFKRVQLNFHSIAHKVDVKLLSDTIAKFPNIEFIFQLDGVNDHIPIQCSYKVSNISVLHDKSGGAGISPEAWPAPIPGISNGYAGGLGPDNLKDQIETISDLVGTAEIWVDMERKVRNDDDSLFDLKKVEDCLAIGHSF